MQEVWFWRDTLLPPRKHPHQSVTTQTREVASAETNFSATRCYCSGAKREIVFDVVARLPNQFQYADIERACPGVSRPTINRALAELWEKGQIHCIKPGRDAVWEKTRSLSD